MTEPKLAVSKAEYQRIITATAMRVIRDGDFPDFDYIVEQAYMDEERPEWWNDSTKKWCRKFTRIERQVHDRVARDIARAVDKLLTERINKKEERRKAREALKAAA